MSAALLQCEMEFLVLHRRTHTFSSVDSNYGTGPGGHAPQSLLFVMNSRRSAFSTSAFTVSIPCEKPG
ncbi:hypothetical protein CDO27_22650 (plasmid) [Sinorhizobium meliloti]|nr:hypothetical protein SMRU11_10955 [Sinorhizobium meliloti RU11/001]ASP66707.1 hypothetical protein CDO29_19145 [Sinorhizobium meliloti]ASP80719.1 hypothetical protein CDO27_22650 [Sinorhizobium meliloti]CCM71172.1 hypothetical protein BN406_04890 [Sinorhizobium meliloti Rm41]